MEWMAHGVEWKKPGTKNIHSVSPFIYIKNLAKPSLHYEKSGEYYLCGWLYWQKEGPQGLLSPGNGPSIIWVLVTWVCPAWGDSSNHTFMIRVLLYKGASIKVSEIFNLWNQSWIFIGRTNAEAPILWPSDAKNWLIEKDPDAGKGWRQEEKGMTEDELVGWHHWLDGHEFEQALEVGDGQGSLVCCSPWGHRESDTTEWLNWTYELGGHYAK